MKTTHFYYIITKFHRDQIKFICKFIGEYTSIVYSVIVWTCNIDC